MWYAGICTGILEAGESAVGGNVFSSRRIEMDQNIAMILNEKRSSFIGTEIVICVDTADELVLTFNCNNRDLQVGELAGGECMGEDDKPLNFVRHQLLNVAALCFIVTVCCENKKFVAIFFIRSKKLIQHFRIVVHGKARDQDTDEFGLSIRENFCHLIFFIIQFFQCIGNNLLIFQGQGIRIVEIAGNCCLGKMRVLCNIVKGYVLFFDHCMGPSFRKSYVPDLDF